MGGTQQDNMGIFSANRPFTARAIRVSNSMFLNRSVGELEKYFSGIGHRVFVMRLRQQDKLVESSPGLTIGRGDTIILSGRTEFILEDVSLIGAEVHDKALLDFPIEVLDVVLTDKTIEGLTLQQLAANDFTHGVGLRKLVRGDNEMPFTAGTKLDRGDVLTIVRPREAAFAPHR